MASDPKQLTPAEAQQQINAKQADPQFAAALMDKNALGHADAMAEMRYLFGLVNPPTSPAQITPEVKAAAARAERLNRAMLSYDWPTGDREIIADQLGRLLTGLPDGAYSPPAFAAPATRPAAILPQHLIQKFADPTLAGEAREAAAQELDTALSVLAPNGAGT